MSGECDECSEHAADCKCNPFDQVHPMTECRLCHKMQCICLNGKIRIDHIEDMTRRTNNVLTRLNVVYLSDLEKYSSEELLLTKNFGKCCLKEVREILARHGMKLKDDILLIKSEDIKTAMKLLDFIGNIQENLKEFIKDVNRISLKKADNSHEVN